MLKGSKNGRRGIETDCLDRLEQLVSEFDSSLRRAGGDNEYPQIEVYLNRIDESLRLDLLRSLLRVEREFFHQRGQPGTAGDYKQRFPQYGSMIDGVLMETLPVPKRLENPKTDSPASNTKRKHRAVPSQIDRYQIERRLGRGGFADVYLAYDPKLDRHVALKVARFQSSEEVDDFLREAKVLASLRHASLVAVFDADRTAEGICYLAMEFIEGQSLRDELARRQPNFDETVEMLITIAQATHYLHQHGIIHRDLKPANILIDADNQPLVVDLGLAKVASADKSITVPGDIVGTPNYMSPEQAWGDSKHIDHRTDVYGLGAIMYRMLAGKPPFSGRAGTVLHQVRAEEPVSPRRLNRQVPRDLETICLAAMQKEPQRRYSTAQDFADDLKRYQDNLPIVARPVPASEKVAKWIKRHRTLSGVTLVFVLLLGSILGVAGWRIWRDEKRLAQALDTRVPVNITTEPPGAYMKLIPRDKNTFVLQTNKAIELSEKTPIRDYLVEPGDYRIVVIKDGWGSHEVERRVPESFDETPNAEFAHKNWTLFGRNTIRLPTIFIPNDREVIANMVFIPGGEFMVGVEGDAGLPMHKQMVGDFYCCRLEVTVAQWRKVWGVVPGDMTTQYPILDDQMGVSHITWDQALRFCERTGARLPTEFELLYLATNSGETRFPWGDDSKPIGDEPPSYSERSPFDVTRKWKSPIHGLFSGVAEWTLSCAIPYAQLAPEKMTDENDPKRLRDRPLPYDMKEKLRNSFITGGGIPPYQNNIGGANWKNGVRNMRRSLPRSQRSFGVGLRCVKVVHKRNES